MKRMHITLAVSMVAAMVLISNPILAAETYNVDTTHSYVLFKINHLGVGNSFGRFNGPAGSFVWDDANPANSSIEMQVKSADVDTNVDKRDNHIRSADFLNADKYDIISFKSTSVKKVGADTYEVTGDLNLLGKSHPITLTARQTGAGKDPWGKYRRGFETTFTIKRTTWGMDFMLNGLSDAVEVSVSVEGVRQ